MPFSRGSREMNLCISRTLPTFVTGASNVCKSGSARQSVKMFVLREFLETHILVLCSCQRQHSHQNGQNSEFAVEMALGGT
jgi:hypothetical protein